MSMQIGRAKSWTNDHQQLLDFIATKENYKALLLLENFEKFHGTLDVADNSGMTLLHHAVKYENLSMVHKFIDKGCNVNTIDQLGNSPLTTALSIENNAIVELLFQNNANIYEPTNALLVILNNSTQDFQPIIKIFEKVTTDFLSDKREMVLSTLNGDNFTKFVAVVFGNIELAEYFLKNNYPVDFKDPMGGFTALSCAIKHARMENAKMLIRYGAKVRAWDDLGHSPLHYYSEKCGILDKQFEVLKSLVKGSIASAGNINSIHTVRADLERLIIDCKKPIVKAVLQCGINVKKYFKKSKSLVEMLILNKNSDVIDLLDELNIEFDVDQKCKNEQLNGIEMGNSVLALTLVKRCVKKIKFLLDHGAKVNISQRRCHIALNVILMYESRGRRNSGSVEQNSEAEVIELLLKHDFNDTQVSDAKDWIILPIVLRNIEYRSSSQVVFAHLALLEALNKSPLDYYIRNCIQSTTALRTQYYFHIRQLEEIKNNKLRNRISIFEILTENNEKQLRSIARHEEFKIEFDRFVENTPLASYYFNTIQKKVNRIVDSIALERKAAVALEKMTGLCSFVVYNIVSYLKDLDFNNVCEAESIVNIIQSNN